MKGPEKSAYEGGRNAERYAFMSTLMFLSIITGVFTLGVKFPSKYPAVPPEVRFLTRVCLKDDICIVTRNVYHLFFFTDLSL